MSHVGPLVLEPIFKERIWGATSLPEPYPQPATGTRIGEVWLTAEECVVTGGSLAGKTLREAAADEPAALQARDGFPLLLKVLLPRERLSVQVHPDDAQAQQLGEARGKTECWYVLDAEPGAEVAVGLREPLSNAAIAAAIADGSLESKLRMLPVKAGDMVFVDAGTVHAIGPGMTVLETQEYSDITYRLFDYGRPRELHVEQGLAVTRTDTQAGYSSPVTLDGYTRLVSCPYFVVDRLEIKPGTERVLDAKGSLQLLFALAPGCTLVGDGASLELPQGKVVVLPAEAAEYRLRAPAASTVMRVLAP